MDFSVLVDEIARRVGEKMAAAEMASADVLRSNAAEKPGILVLSQAREPSCAALMLDTRLTACYRLDCAGAVGNAPFAVEDYEAVILLDLSVEAMARLAGGVCDTLHTNLAQRAILLGKRIYVAAQDVELLTFGQTIPNAYDEMLHKQLDLLQRAGVRICPTTQALADEVLLGEKQAVCSPAAACPVTITKRVITERDLAGVCDRSVTAVRVAKKSIITDLAREYAAARNVSIVRET